MSSNTPDDTPGIEGDTSSIKAVYAGAKRRIATLEQQIQNLQEAGTKRKSDMVSNVNTGRLICRLVSMFDKVEELVDEKDRRRALELEEEAEAIDPVESTLEQDRAHRGYELLVQHVKGIEDKLLDLDPSQLGGYFRDLQRGAGAARGDDAANLKPVVVSWVGPMFDPGHAHAPLSPTNKSERGFEHHITGKLLCPIDFEWGTPEVREQIRDGHEDFAITADSWPAFLYPHGKAENPDDLEIGLFRSALMVKAFKFIFTSPTSAEDIENETDLDAVVRRPHKRNRRQRAPTKGNVASIIGMKSVTPRSIAYVALQLRFALSNASSWNESDGCFSYSRFYNNIIDFFEATPGPASQKQSRELLAWWSSKVFGKKTIPTAVASRSNSSVAKMAAQRAARERALQE